MAGPVDDEVVGSAATVLQYPLGVGEMLTRVLEVRGSGTPCLLLHGAGARADRWRSSLEVLGARGIHGVALDLPGHGFASKGPAIEMTVPAFANFVAGALNELDVTDAVLVGTSLGAHVMARLALDHPGLARRLVLVGPTGLLPLGQQMRSAIAANLRKRDLEGIRRKLARVVSDGRTVDESWVHEEFAINNSPGADESFKRLASYVETRLDDDGFAAALKTVGCGCPIMVVWGEDDTVVPIGTREQVVASCGPAEVALVPNAGHLPYAENTEEFWKSVLPFIED